MSSCDLDVTLSFLSCTENQVGDNAPRQFSILGTSSVHVYTDFGLESDPLSFHGVFSHVAGLGDPAAGVMGRRWHRSGSQNHRENAPGGDGGKTTKAKSRVSTEIGGVMPVEPRASPPAELRHISTIDSDNALGVERN